MLQNNRDIVVIGASLGGPEAVRGFLSQLPADFPASIFITIHLGPNSTNSFVKVFDRAGPLRASPVQDYEPIQRGRIYVAPPERHLLIMEDHLRLVAGPRENRWRPAIDPMFRTAAVAYSSRVIGIILSGLLDDGTSGLLAVKRCGGVAIVQQPEDALSPEMPLSALNAMEVDHVAPVATLATLLNELVRSATPARPAIPEAVINEAKIAERSILGHSTDGAERKYPDQASPYSCPDCDGPLYPIDDPSQQRFRCLVGHAHTERSLLSGQNDSIERALWTAMRSLEQKHNLIQLRADVEQKEGRDQSAESYQKEAEEIKSNVDVIRSLLLASSPETSAPETSAAAN